MFEIHQQQGTSLPTEETAHELLSTVSTLTDLHHSETCLHSSQFGMLQTEN